MSEASTKTCFRRRRGRLLIGAAIGTGMAANFAIRGGADFLLALNAGRLRSMGEPSVTSMLALKESNAFVMAFATSEILPRSTVPVIFGACTLDPRQDLASLVGQVRDSGFAGVANFPTVTMLGGPFRKTLEREGLGFDRELAMLIAARRAGLVAVAYTHSEREAEAAARAGVDLINIGLGWNQGGAGGAGASSSVEEAAIHVGRVARVVAGIAPGTPCLVEGGPIVGPRHLEELCRFVNIDGYIGGSTIDRVPLETAIEEVTASFRAIGPAPGAEIEDRTAGNPAFPIHLAGSSEAIRKARSRLVHLATTERPVHLVLADAAAAVEVAETLHRLSRRRRIEPVVVHLGARDAEARRIDLFGSAADARAGHQRARMGWLEVASGGTLILRAAPGAARELVEEVAEATRRGRSRRAGGERAASTDVRLLLASGPEMDAIPGLARFELPPLAARREDVPAVLEMIMRGLRTQLRRPRLRIDAAAWRIIVEREWPGDAEELRATIEAAALAAEGEAITPVELATIPAGPGRATIFASEKDWILDGLRKHRFQRSAAAAYLGISRKTLYNKMRRYALDRIGADT